MPSFPPVWSSTNEFLPSRLTLINWLIGKFDVKIANKKSRHFVKIFCHRNRAGFPPLTQTPYDNLIISEVTESSSSHQLGEGPEGTPPPPLLPPKTRKLPGVAQAGLTPLSGQVVTGSQQGNNTKRHFDGFVTRQTCNGCSFFLLKHHIFLKELTILSKKTTVLHWLKIQNAKTAKD